MSKKTIADTKKAGGEIIVQVKNNQPYLKKKLLNAMNSNRENDSITTTEKNRGRIETRTVKSFDIREQLGNANFKKRITNSQIWDHWNKHIKSVIYVERKTEIFDHNTKSWKVSIEDSLYTETYIDSAKQFADQIIGGIGLSNLIIMCVIRLYWKINQQSGSILVLLLY